MKLNNWKKTLLGALVASSLYGCNAPQPQDSAAQSREEVVNASGTMPVPGPAGEKELGAPEKVTESYSQGGEWICTAQKFQASEAPDDFVTFEPNPAVIWPGSLLQGATLESGAPEPIPVKRAGGTVLMNLVNANTGATVGSYQSKLGEINQGNVIDAQNTILANNAGSTPAAFSFEAVKVDSEEELALAMNARVEWMTGSVAASLKFSQEQRYTRYLVKLTQRYYTMVYQTPTSLEEVFHESVTPEQLGRYVGPGNPATYISSVTYGRQFYLLFESTASKQELEAALSVMYDNKAVQASVELQATYRKVEAQTKVKAFAVGGSAGTTLEGVLAATNANFDKLHEAIVKGGDFGAGNPGLPISYTVRNVSDNKLVKVGVATEFVRKTCVPVVKNDRFTALWLDAQSLPATANGTLLTTWPGKTLVQNDGRGTGGWYTVDGINGHPAVRFGQLGTRLETSYTPVFNVPYQVEVPAYGHFLVDLGGGSVVGDQYTVVAVTKTAATTFQNLFLQGTGLTPNSNLYLGFEYGQKLVQGHYANDLRSQASPTANGDVLTFRFSASEGKATWQNGLRRGASAQTERLVSNLGTRIGGDGVTPFVGLVGEVRVFSYALTDAQRKVTECELAKKWSIAVADCVDGQPDPKAAQY